MESGVAGGASYTAMKVMHRDRGIAAAVVTLFLLLLCARAGQSAIFTVTSVADPGNGACTIATTGDGCTLREAITAANSNSEDDLINFAAGVAGTIQLTRALPGLSTNINLSGPGATKLIVRRNTGGDYRVFTVGNGTASGPSVTVSGMTISNGNVVVGLIAGGGIFNDGGSLAISACTLSSNKPDGVFTRAGVASSFIATGCTFTNNQSRGISLRADAGASVNYSVTTCNSSGNGVGLEVFTLQTGTASGVVTRCTFNNNAFGMLHSGVNGGKSTTEVAACSVNNNSSGGMGNFSQNDTSKATMTLQDCTISNNKGGSLSGGVSNDAAGGVALSTLTVENTTFSNNSSAGGGAGLLNSAIANGTANARILNCTFNGNVATSGGGNNVHNIGIDGNNLVGSAQVSLGSTIFQNGSSGPNFFNNTGAIASEGWNLCNDDGGGFLGGSGDQTNSDALLGPLANNGGLTLTHAPLAGSPALDKGKNISGTSLDQRGGPRIFDFNSIDNANGGDATDVGAVEVQGPPQQTGPTFTVTTITDHNDGACGVADCTLREAITAANAIAGGDTINFKTGLTGTIQLTGALPDFRTVITLLGPGADKITVRRDSGGDYRIFSIVGGTSVSISDLTVSNGKAIGNGGGVLNDHSDLTLRRCILTDNTASGIGGGVFNNGFDSGGVILTIFDCLFSGNKAFAGGGLYNLGTVIGSASANLAGCTFSNNLTQSSGGGITSSGFNGGTASMTVNNCTFSNNAVNPGGGGSGGGIHNVSGSGSSNTSLSVRNSTFSGNGADQGGGIYNDGFSGGPTALTLGNTIFQASSQGVNLKSFGTNATLTTQGFNLSDDDGGGLLTNSTDLKFTDAKLDAAGLKNNGGPTPTIALQSSSPAIDAGNSLGAIVDQRGVPRPQTPSGSADIGAFELVQPVQSGPIFTVNTLDDDSDGVCTTARCTLREAVAAANANTTDANTIGFAPGLTGTLRLTGGLLALNGPVTINGPGARILAVSNQAGPGNRIFSVISGVSSIAGLTLRDGAMVAGAGVGAEGGAIFNQATLTLTDCFFIANRAQGGGGLPGQPGGVGRGGAISNLKVLSVNRCLFLTCTANGGRGGDNSEPGNIVGGRGGDAQGGAIFNGANSTLSMSNCTIVVSNAAGGAGGFATPGGGGVANIGGDGGDGSGAIFNRGSMSVTACTLTANTGEGGAPGVSDAPGRPGKGSGGLVQSALGGSSIVRNTLSARNTGSNGGGPDADGAFASQGFNLIADATGGSGFTRSTDQVGGNGNPVLDARLGTLRNNGGPTDTVALLAGSPAIDKGNRFGLTTDQRRQFRPYDQAAIANAAGGDGSDIGACENGPATPSFQFAATGFSVTEGAATAVITVTRFGFNDGAASVNYATGNISAVAGSDYTTTTGTLTFAAGESSKTFTVPIINNPVCEPIETFRVALAGASAGNALGSPSSATVTIYDEDCSFTISGRVANHSGTGLANVQVTRSGGVSVFTNSTGNYSFTGVKQGTCTVTPIVSASLNGVTFTPASTTVTVNTASLANINFTASFTISGRVANSNGAGIPNVPVTRTTSSSGASTTSDSTGAYRFSGVPNGGYTIAPAVTAGNAGMSFFPTSTNVTVSTSNVGNINFTAFFSISGKVTTSSGAGIPNVLVTRSSGGSSTSVVTNGSGNYTFGGVRSGTYSITPSQSGKTFSPTSKSVAVNSANVTNVNFIGS